MKKMKELWPDQKLVLVCRQGLGDFFLRTRLVDEVFEIKKGQRDSYQRVVEALKTSSVHTLVSPHESLRTAFFSRKIKARQKISFAKAWNRFFYGLRVAKNYELPDALRQLSLLQSFDVKLQYQIEAYASSRQAYRVDKTGLLSAPPEWASMSLREFYETEKERLAPLLTSLGLGFENLKKAVALFPGSVWATKRWTETGYIQTGRKLAQQGIPVLVMGGPGEEDLCERVAQAIPQALNLCAKTSIFESALLLSQMVAVVGNDSASMHLAATSGTPSVVIFGPTILQFGFRPWQDKVYVVEKSDLSCRPCGKHGHKACPLRTHACMKRLVPEEVLQKVQSLLHAGPR